MAFVTGLFLIDAPASALNNLGAIPGEREDNTAGVKVIKTKEGYFPYVSAQAFRYWLRTTLQERVPTWKAAPIYREEKIAYTDANPLYYWDDDLFGYMRAPSKKESAKARREADTSRTGETETTDTITRVAPFRDHLSINFIVQPSKGWFRSICPPAAPSPIVIKRDSAIWTMFASSKQKNLQASNI